jgi:hypothetical protein
VCTLHRRKRRSKVTDYIEKYHIDPDGSICTHKEEHRHINSLQEACEELNLVWNKYRILYLDKIHFSKIPCSGSEEGKSK